MSHPSSETDADEASSADQSAQGAGMLGHALLAWVVIAVLTVVFATIVAVDAQAAPYAVEPTTDTHGTRMAGLLLVGGLGGLAAVICAVMWRDLPRQTEIPRPNPDRF